MSFITSILYVPTYTSDTRTASHSAIPCAPERRRATAGGRHGSYGAHTQQVVRHYGLAEGCRMEARLWAMCRSGSRLGRKGRHGSWVMLVRLAGEELANSLLSLVIMERL